MAALVTPSITMAPYSPTMAALCCSRRRMATISSLVTFA
jgi:hypothetical protein